MIFRKDSKKSFKGRAFRRASALLAGLLMIGSFQNCERSRFAVNPSSIGTSLSASVAPSTSTTLPTPTTPTPQPNPLPINDGFTFTVPITEVAEKDCAFKISSVADLRTAIATANQSSFWTGLAATYKGVYPSQINYCLLKDLDFNGDILLTASDYNKNSLVTTMKFPPLGQQQLSYGGVTVTKNIVLAGNGHTIRNINLNTTWPFAFTQDAKFLDWSATIDYVLEENYMYSSYEVALFASLKNSIVSSSKPFRITSGFYTNCVVYDGSLNNLLPIIGCGGSQAQLNLFRNKRNDGIATSIVDSQITLSDVLFHGGQMGIGGDFKNSKVNANLTFETLKLTADQTKPFQAANSDLKFKIKAIYIGTRPDLQLINLPDYNYLFPLAPDTLSGKGGKLDLDIELVDFKKFTLFYLLKRSSVNFRDLDIKMKLKTSATNPISWVGLLFTYPDEIYGLGYFCPATLSSAKLDFTFDLNSKIDAGLIAGGLCNLGDPAGLTVQQSTITVKMATTSLATDKRFTLRPRTVLAGGAQAQEDTGCHRSVISGLIAWYSTIATIPQANCPSLEPIYKRYEVPFTTQMPDPFGNGAQSVAFAALNLTDSEVNVLVEPKHDRIATVRSQAGGILGHYSESQIPMTFRNSHLRSEVSSDIRQFESSGAWIMEQFGGAITTDSESVRSLVGNGLRSVWEKR